MTYFRLILKPQTMLVELFSFKQKQKGNEDGELDC